MYIVAIRRRNNHIVEVQVKDNLIINGGLLASLIGSPVTYTKDDIVVKINNGLDVFTAYEENGKWIHGAKVRCYKDTQNFWFLKTDVDNSRKDNLDNLPKF
jgi:hypothetical protein